MFTTFNNCHFSFFEQYENLRAQATTMKDRYEERILEIEGDKDTLAKARGDLKERVRQLQVAVQKAEVQADVAAAAAAVAGTTTEAGKASHAVVADEVSGQTSRKSTVC